MATSLTDPIGLALPSEITWAMPQTSTATAVPAAMKKILLIRLSDTSTLARQRIVIRQTTATWSTTVAQSGHSTPSATWRCCAKAVETRGKSRKTATQESQPAMKPWIFPIVLSAQM